jgi:hypothetical protein
VVWLREGVVRSTFGRVDILSLLSVDIPASEERLGVLLRDGRVVSGVEVLLLSRSLSGKVSLIKDGLCLGAVVRSVVRALSGLPVELRLLVSPGSDEVAVLFLLSG